MDRMGGGSRYLEWSYDPDPNDSVGTSSTRSSRASVDGRVATFSETHVFGVFPQSTWLSRLERAGFVPEVLTERTEEDRSPRALFVARRAR